MPEAEDVPAPKRRASKLHDHPSSAPADAVNGYEPPAEARKSMLARHATERQDLHARHADAIAEMNDKHEAEHQELFAPAPPKSPIGGDPSYSRGR